MAVTIAALTFAYGLIVVLLVHYMAERLRARPWIGSLLEKTAGVFLIGFGLKLATGR
jgi:threonine/homoserine/homoserine lactone efflux protein